IFVSHEKGKVATQSCHSQIDTKFGVVMSKRPSISFSDFAAPEKGVSIVLVAKGGGFADEAALAAGGAEKIRRIAEISGFTGALGKTAEAIETTPGGVEKIVLVGVGEPGKLGNDDWLKIGGAAFARIGKAERATVTLALPETTIAGDEAADLALGMILRSYKFERYKTRKNNEDNGDPKHAAKVSICVADPHTRSEEHTSELQSRENLVC